MHLSGTESGDLPAVLSTWRPGVYVHSARFIGRARHVSGFESWRLGSPCICFFEVHSYCPGALAGAGAYPGRAAIHLHQPHPPCAVAGAQVLQSGAHLEVLWLIEALFFFI